MIVTPKDLRQAFLAIALALLTGAGQSQSQKKDSVYQLFSTPNAQGHVTLIAAIQNAHAKINMTMYHLTEQKALDALIEASRRGVAVRIVIDGHSLRNYSNERSYRYLLAHGVAVVPSSSRFSLTHAKSMTVDDSAAYVTTMNLTNSAQTFRDFGIRTTDQGNINEINRVFEADWLNAQSQTNVTPSLHEPSLLWSPVNAQAGLENLINSAQNSLVSMTETLDNPIIVNALIRASQRGVNVRLIVPMCVSGNDALFNYPAIQELLHGGVQVRTMPSPSSPALPYTHAKMISIDQSAIYIGSINFTRNSASLDREVGIIANDANVIKEVADIFQQDWGKSVESNATPGDICSPPAKKAF